MNLKSDYGNLPYFIQQKVTYQSLKNYIFFGMPFPKHLQKMISNKTPGYSHALSIKSYRQVAKDYGCTNEAQLLEAGEIILRTKLSLFSNLVDSFKNLSWQKPQLN